MTFARDNAFELRLGSHALLFAVRSGLDAADGLPELEASELPLESVLNRAAKLEGKLSLCLPSGVEEPLDMTEQVAQSRDKEWKARSGQLVVSLLEYVQQRSFDRNNSGPTLLYSLTLTSDAPGWNCR